MSKRTEAEALREAVAIGILLAGYRCDGLEARHFRLELQTLVQAIKIGDKDEGWRQLESLLWVRRNGNESAREAVLRTTKDEAVRRLNELSPQSVEQLIGMLRASASPAEALQAACEWAERMKAEA